MYPLSFSSSFPPLPCKSPHDLISRFHTRTAAMNFSRELPEGVVQVTKANARHSGIRHQTADTALDPYTKSV